MEPEENLGFRESDLEEAMGVRRDRAHLKVDGVIAAVSKAACWRRTSQQAIPGGVGKA